MFHEKPSEPFFDFNCGRLADVSFDDLTASLRAQLGEDFSYYDLKVYYLCPQCRAEQCKTDEKGECE